jgi:hydroxyquinol 1,2-dioxygenase
LNFETTIYVCIYTDSPVLPNGADLFDSKSSSDQPIYIFHGRVLSSDGHPIPGAVLDVWHSDDHGYYDVQRQFLAERSHIGFRGKFISAEDGSWCFRTLPVKSYMLPLDGPVVRYTQYSSDQCNLQCESIIYIY